MRIRTWLGCGLMAIGLTVLAAEDDGAKTIADKSDDGAAKMIAAIEAIKPPALDSSRIKDQDYVRAFMNEQKVFNDKRGELAKEFYREFPDHPKAFIYLSSYWQALTSSGHADAALAEIDQMLADHPTVARQSNLLYSGYKDKGVEFIGISLDYPGDGLAKLKGFVTQNEIAWPQYYQGQGWQSAFSGEWGVNSIPCVFVVDAAGNLYSTDARGKVPKIIDTLLAKR
jgi:hypothetical protein